jgi:hypothetical protein
MTDREYFEELMEDGFIGENQLINAFKTGEIKSLIAIGEEQSINGNIWRDYNVNGYYKISVLFKKDKK